MTKNSEKKAFARRFENSEWQTLCSKIEFLDALDRSVEAAEIAAQKILNPDLSMGQDSLSTK